MPKFERLDFPKKYPIPGWIKVAVFAIFFMGVGIHNCSEKQLTEEIKITKVTVTEYSKVHIEVQYSISNYSHIDRDVWLLLTAYNTEGVELGSSLFQVTAKAGKVQPMIKIMDKLPRALNIDEKPGKATVVLYKRKVI